MINRLRRADGDAGGGHVGFRFGDSEFAEVEDGCGKDGVGFALGGTVDEDRSLGQHGYDHRRSSRATRPLSAEATQSARLPYTVAKPVLGVA